MFLSGIGHAGFLNSLDMICDLRLPIGVFSSASMSMMGPMSLHAQSPQPLISGERSSIPSRTCLSNPLPHSDRLTICFSTPRQVLQHAHARKRWGMEWSCFRAISVECHPIPMRGSNMRSQLHTMIDRAVKKFKKKKGQSKKKRK